jgi:tRNA1Val (adenine37-N6)-methyltransferase
MFHFKQFSVDQSGCAMKINTDGVLLGALAEADDPQQILDIGTGTGVIALMLAQRFTNAQIDAVEIDEDAALTAGANFKNSPFATRLNIFPVDFERFFEEHSEKKYDLIVSNPPFYLKSLESPEAKKSLAKHANEDFFESLISNAAQHLTQKGLFWMILPLQAAGIVKALAQQHNLFPQKNVAIQSFAESEPHREIICFGFEKVSVQLSNLTIYNAVNVYSEEYKKFLQPYFIVF